MIICHKTQQKFNNHLANSMQPIIGVRRPLIIGQLIKKNLLKTQI